MPQLNRRTISATLVQELIREQFPQWAHLTIKSVAVSGWDNWTFRLGSNMLVRLPSAQKYAEQVTKEHYWLPRLAAHLSVQIPEPLRLGQPSKNYPWNWSIYRWIEGISANLVSWDNDTVLCSIAQDLAQFLQELHAINQTGDLTPGLHNFWRGAHLTVYDEQVRSQISGLCDIINSTAALALWQTAISSSWHHDPVWLHGDLSSGNIIINNEKLAAVIDFGCMAIGDPACDLTIAWTFLKGEARHIFKEYVNADPNTWKRARGWALWKATFELCNLPDTSSIEAIKHRRIIEEILNEQHEFDLKHSNI